MSICEKIERTWREEGGEEEDRRELKNERRRKSRGWEATSRTDGE